MDCLDYPACPCSFYNPAVQTPAFTAAQRHGLWARLATLAGLVAVFSAMLAPLSMLAADVRSGSLGGVCTQSLRALAPFGVGNGGFGDAQPLAAASNQATKEAGVPSSGGQAVQLAACDLCGAFGLVPARLALALPQSAPARSVPSRNLPSDLALSLIGLPFSHGPPQRFFKTT